MQGHGRMRAGRPCFTKRVVGRGASLWTANPRLVWRVEQRGETAAKVNQESDKGVDWTNAGLPLPLERAAAPVCAYRGVGLPCLGGRALHFRRLVPFSLGVTHDVEGEGWCGARGFVDGGLYLLLQREKKGLRGWLLSFRVSPARTSSRVFGKRLSASLTIPHPYPCCTHRLSNAFKSA